MKKLLIISILILSFKSYAQEKPIHEIGIGIGYLEYNPSRATPNLEPWFHQSLFKQDALLLGKYRKDIIRLDKHVVSPTLYYSNRMSAREMLRTSFQYQYQKGAIINTFFNEINRIADYRFVLKQVNWTLGYSYSFLKLKSIQFYGATDLEVMLTKGSYSDIKDSKTYDGGFESWSWYYIDEEKMESATQFQFNPIISVGAHIPIFRSLSLTYEGSIKTIHDEIRFRTLNRFSLNYAF